RSIRTPRNTSRTCAQQTLHGRVSTLRTSKKWGSQTPSAIICSAVTYYFLRRRAVRWKPVNQQFGATRFLELATKRHFYGSERSICGGCYQSIFGLCSCETV